MYIACCSVSATVCVWQVHWTSVIGSRFMRLTCKWLTWETLIRKVVIATVDKAEYNVIFSPVALSCLSCGVLYLLHNVMCGEATQKVGSICHGGILAFMIWVHTCCVLFLNQKRITSMNKPESLRSTPSDATFFHVLSFAVSKSTDICSLDCEWSFIISD